MKSTKTVSFYARLKLNEDTPERIRKVCFGRFRFYLQKAKMEKRSEYDWIISRTVSEEYLSRAYIADTFINYHLLNRHLSSGSLVINIDNEPYAEYVFADGEWVLSK